MSKSVFLSHKYEDGKYKNKIKKWSEEGRLGNVVATGETEDVRQGGAKAVREHIDPKLQGAGAVVVLLGDDSHNSVGVRDEIAYAKAHNKQIIPVRIPGTTGAAPAAIRDLDEIALDPSAIQKALKK